jgi:hypothetical protein
MLMRFERFIDELAVLFVVDQQVEIETDIFSVSACVGVGDVVFTLQDHLAYGVLKLFTFLSDNFIAPAARIFQFEFLINVVDIHHFCLLSSIQAVRRI